MRVFILLALFILSGAAFAASTASSVSQAPAAAKLKGSFSIGRSNSLYIENGISQIASWDFAGSLSYKLPYNLTAGAAVDASQDIKNPESSDFGSASLRLTYNPESSKASTISIVPSIRFAFPVSRAANSASLKGSFTAAARATVNPEVLFSKKFSLGFSLSGTRHIHEFDTNAAGLANNQYGSTQGFSAGWNFTDELSLSFEYSHINAWTYQGTMKEYFSHSQELGYQWNDSWSVAAGHSYGAPYVSVWKADRQTYNTNLTDETNSIVYGQVAYTF